MVSPRAGILVEMDVETSLDDPQIAEDLFTREPDALDIMGVKPAAIADGQLAAGFFARVNHLLAFFRRHFHRLFAKHVFAGVGRLDGVFGVERVGGDDIHNVNVRVVGHFLHRVVVVDVPVGNVVLGLPFFRLGGCAGDDAGEAAEFRVLQGGRNLVGAQAAETDQGHAKLFVGPGGEGPRR